MSLSASGPSVNAGYESSSSSSEESYAGQVLLGDLSEAGTSYGTLPFTGARGQAQGNQLGWIMGVFVPTMLGILGVVTFLRMGWVVGEVSSSTPRRGLFPEGISSPVCHYAFH